MSRSNPNRVDRVKSVCFFCFITGCGSVANNSLKSPGYPDKYPLNMDCVYLVPIPHGLTMKISFKDFNLEHDRVCE